jgi:hypothetical protein
VRTIIEWVKGVWHILAVTWDNRPRPFERLPAVVLFVILWTMLTLNGIYLGSNHRVSLIAVTVMVAVAYRAGNILVYRAKQFQKRPYSERIIYEAVLQYDNDPSREVTIGVYEDSKVPEVDLLIKQGETPHDAWYEFFRKMAARQPNTRLILMRELKKR